MSMHITFLSIILTYGVGNGERRRAALRLVPHSQCFGRLRMLASKRSKPRRTLNVRDQIDGRLGGVPDHYAPLDHKW